MNTLLMNSLTEKGKGIALTVLFALMIALGLPGEGACADNQFDYSSQTMRVGVWIDNLDEGDVLDRGEEINVGFQTNEDAYAVVYRINTDGLVSVLWPRSRMDDGFVFGGHEYLMPVTGAPRLVAGSSTGEGFIEAVVSKYPFDLRDLALDFHHEYDAEKFNFMVSGDPFLAINEVNFAITGMEDSADFVVTNYLNYYVHKQVEHPRYLCSQCHDDDDLADNPYENDCTFDITVDYGWANDWYNEEGYYPVYYNPVYVYYDPWTWRPWVNFWYEPYYTCPTRPGFHYNYTSYVWCDSPYYKYDGIRVKTGRGLYQRPGQSSSSGRPRTSDYTGVSGRIAQRGPTDSERISMKQKRPVQGIDGRIRNGGNIDRNHTGSVVTRGEKPMARKRPVFDSAVRSTSRGGLQIRPSGNRQTTKPRTHVGRKENLSPVRTQPGSNRSSGRPRGLFPVRGNSGSGTGSTTTVRGSSRSIPDRNQSVKPSGRSSSSSAGRIKPVEPRKKGTRIWNSRSGSQTGDRKVRKPARSSSGRKSNSGSSVKPRSRNSESGRTGRSSSAQVKPKSSSRSSGSSSGSKSSSRSSSSRSSSGKSSSKSSRSGSGRGSGSSHRR